MKNNLLVNLINSTVLGDKRRKQQLIRLIQVDLENVNYEIFTDKYSKKLYGNDLFLFFNHKNDLIGATIGAIYQKDFEEFGVGKYLYENFRKNRSGLEEHATIIIRIPASERYYTPRYNKKYRAVKNNLIYDKELKIRLREFKKSKYENVSDDDIVSFENEVVNYIMKNLRNNEALNVFEKVCMFSVNTPSLLREFSNEINEYESVLKQVNEEKETFKDRDLNWRKEKSWYYNRLLEVKKTICEWHECLI